MPLRNSFTYNTLIEGYMKCGSREESLKLFSAMPERNDFSWNIVVTAFVKAGELGMARGLFEGMPRKNAIVWNSMIHGYAKNGCPKEALRLFKDLNSDPCETSRSDTFVLATVIRACADLLALDWGKQIHARVIAEEVEFDSVLGSSLVNLYGKCGDLNSASHALNTMHDPDDFSLSALISGYASCGRMDEAKRIFQIRSDPCAVLWNSIIAGYVTNCEGIEALVLFGEMRKSGVRGDSSTFSSILSACSTLGIREYGKQIHAHASKFGFIDDLIVATALVDTYAKCGRPIEACKLFSELKTHDTILLNSMITIYSSCGRVEDAKRVFETMPSKSLISWNSMIVGLSQNGYPVEALDLFCKMNTMDVSTDKYCLASVISACASISSLEFGEQIHARAIFIGLDFDQIVSTSLVDFYCKCGFVEDGWKLFNEMIKSDEVSWNTMLMGYATNGYGSEALSLFSEMIRVGVVPTEITFTGVLSACDHCGLVKEGQKWFYAMKHGYNIDPGIEHYSCMVDLFARAGSIEAAMNLIAEMPFEADASMWLSILRGCVAHGNKILGKKVAERICQLDPVNSAAYVQLSSIFATDGDWERSTQVRDVMRVLMEGQDMSSISAIAYYTFKLPLTPMLQFEGILMDRPGVGFDAGQHFGPKHHDMSQFNDIRSSEANKCIRLWVFNKSAMGSKNLMSGLVVVAFDANRDGIEHDFQRVIQNLRKCKDVDILHGGDTIRMLGVMQRVQHPFSSDLGPSETKTSSYNSPGWQLQQSIFSAVATHVLVVDIEVRITAGTSIRKAIVEEVVTCNASWLILDRHLRWDSRLHNKQIPCKIALVLDNLKVTVLRADSTPTSEYVEHKPIHTKSKPVPLLAPQDNENAQQSDISCSYSASINSLESSDMMSSTTYSSRDYSCSSHEVSSGTSKQEKSGRHTKVENQFHPSSVIQTQRKNHSQQRSSDAPVVCSACGMKTELYIKESMRFTYSEIQLATNGFSQENLLGEGGYGFVYKGELKDGQLIGAKLGDFGLAKWKTSDSPIQTRILGTLGYLAPEYAENGVVSVRTDVYAFGIVLIQLISGRKVIDSTTEDYQQSLRQWAEPLIERLALHELIDPRIGDSYDTYELYHMARAAYLCVKSDPQMRPSMGQIVHLLEGESDRFHHLTEQFIPHFAT
ncbi:hypothetical protein RJ640_007407 [Escallonia rubra]|uniref:Protein kinase domain-containing protein n=1 Tax=Escallonia rubra TaxID=112253 RepID=A0AA88QF16_9ASTE|nr:hypothetical protein RJ640_007407 [Escallonia rubra]